jgi:hypothetical protein
MTFVLNAMSGKFFACRCLTCCEPSAPIEKGKGFRTAAKARVFARITDAACHGHGGERAFCGVETVRQNPLQIVGSREFPLTALQRSTIDAVPL